MQRFRALYVAIAICFLESAGFREVRADKPYKKGELVLVPMTSLKLVSIKDPELERTDDLAGNVHVHCKGFDLTIAGPPKPKSKEQKSWSDDALVVPYWWGPLFNRPRTLAWRWRRRWATMVRRCLV